MKTITVPYKDALAAIGDQIKEMGVDPIGRLAWTPPMRGFTEPHEFCVLIGDGGQTLCRFMVEPCETTPET